MVTDVHPRLWAGLALLLAAIAGCTGPSDDGIEREIHTLANDVTDTSRSQDEYWMVWIHGNETDERKNQAVCSRLPPDYRIDRANESVVYENRSYDFEPANVTTLLAFDHEDRSSQCAEAEHLVANPQDAHPQAMGEYGTLSLTVREDGTVLVDGKQVSLGETAEVTYEGTPPDPDKLHVDGRFLVENLGAWDQQRLEPGEPHR